MVTKTDLAEALADQSKDIFKQMDESISKIRDEIINRLLQENKVLNNNIVSLEKKIVKLESKIESNLQYQRNANVIIKGIPSDVPHNALEGIIINLFNLVCYHVITGRDIVACHRVSIKSSLVLVKFVNTKDAISLIEGKEAISKMNTNDLGIGEIGSLYVDEHLSPYIGYLAYRCRCLKREDKILKTKVQKGVVKILMCLEGITKWHIIEHINDIISLIPDYVDVNVSLRDDE